MTMIHAHRRTKDHPVSFNGGVNLLFKPNALGHVVCDVQDESIVRILLDIPTGFRLYEQAQEEKLSPLLTAPPLTIVPIVPAAAIVAPIITGTAIATAGTEAAQIGTTADALGNSPAVTAPPADVTPPPSPYLLVGPGGATFDLRPLEDAALHAFAAANAVKVHPNAKGDTIREKIVAAFAAAKQPE